MLSRFLLVGGAFGVSLVLLGLTLWFGQSATVPEKRPTAAPPDVSGYGIDAADLADPGDLQQQPLQLVHQFELFQEDADGSVTRFAGDEVTPLPEFVSDVKKPVAEVQFAPGRLLLISADEGRFYHPGNVPTRGEFNRNTVVTFYENAAGQPVNPARDDDVKFRLRLADYTQFDREAGRILTEGPVELIGPQVHFVGTGLDLTFNQLADRIERLQIRRGEELRFAQGSAGVGGSEDVVEMRTPTFGERGLPGVEEEKSVEGSGGGQSYRLTLQEDLRITVGQEGATMRGSRLEGLFTLARKAAEKQPPATEGDTTTNAVPPAPAQDEAPAPAGGLFTPQPTDLVVLWRGPLELRPFTPGENEAAAPAAGEARLTLEGSADQPATIDTVRDEHITAAAVGYHSADRTVFARSAPAQPVVIQAAQLGTLTGGNLQIDQAAARGVLVGPGSLVTPDEALTVAFQDAMTLQFQPDSAGRLNALESATFTGQVTAQARPENPQDHLDLSAEQLTLTLTPDAIGQSQPTRLQATGPAAQPVIATQPGIRFVAQSLDAELAPPPEVTSEKSAAVASSTNDAPAAAGVTLTRLRALGQVQLDLTDDQVRLTAHALDASPAARRLELFGDPQDESSQASLAQAGNVLTGRHLILREDEQAADALGAGTFSTAVDPADPQARLNVIWQREMTFDNQQGRASFLGGVSASSTSATDDTSLAAHQLTLQFVPQKVTSSAEPAADVPASPLPAAASPAAALGTGGILDLRQARATADPDNAEDQTVFIAQTFDQDAVAKSPLTRLTLESRAIDFINQPLTSGRDDRPTAIEQLVVPTRGKLLLEDYRTPEADQPAEAADRGSIQLAGRGVTLFAWDNRLLLDAQTNDLRLEGKVWMLHKPARGDEPIKLDAELLVADLTETGGLGAFVQGGAPAAQVRQVNADGNVRLAQGPLSVVADHLEYIESDRQAILWAEPRRMVTLRRADQPSGQTDAKALRWDLRTDTFTAIAPGTGVVPVE